MNKKGHLIKSVIPGSIAEEMDIEPGDRLLRINEKEIKDVFDYHYAVNDEYLVLLIQKPDGEEWEIEIEKDLEEDLGIEFEEGLMDSYRSCRNKCIFCFIDQMPQGMRETLYFKDDDARLSFLQGNYITLTNMSDEDIERIIFYKLSPINISVHTTNKELRNKMLHNRFAGEALDKIKKLYDAGITMNGQIVLCKGINDGKELERTITDLSAYIPHMQSVSVVPVGLTKYRENLTHLEKFQKEDAIRVLDTIHRMQNMLYEKYKIRFVHASDEWYILAQQPIPEADSYEGYLQIENGVGMVRSLLDEFKEYYETLKGDDRKKTVSLATGVLAAPIMKNLMEQIQKKYPNIRITVYTITNEFFGTDITVAGLLTGQDIIKQLKGKNLGDYLLLPDVLLRNGEDVLLDDITVNDLKNTLQTPIRIVQSDGKSLIDAVIN
ncbi:MAG: PDZ domain-containing protein [Lachnoclostridium sp.]|jgi:putative radical SAM enzyme (TIGR03279 family)